MTIPDNLVQAAKTANCLHPGSTWNGRCYQTNHHIHPECALAAAFAALPDCEEIQITCGKALADHYADNPYQTFHHEPSVAAVVIDAIAKMAEA